MIFVYRTTREDVTTVYVDSAEEVAELPTFCANRGIMPGSLAIVCENGSRYRMDSNGTWHKQGGAE